MVVAFSAQSGFVSVVVMASNARTREIPQTLNMLYLLGGELCSAGKRFASVWRESHSRRFAPFALWNSPDAARSLHLSSIHAVIGVFSPCHPLSHLCAVALKPCTATCVERAWRRVRWPRP